MARTCAFCGTTNKIEAEHVWPHWAARRFENDDTFTYYRQFVGAGYEPEAPYTWLQKPFDWKVRAVCKPCNNRWMSDLETAAKDALFGSAFSRHERELPRGAQRTLAAWAIKTAMMVECTNVPSRRGIPRVEYRHVWKRREPSANVRIWLASYAGERAVALALPFGIDVGVHRLPDRERGERHVWGSTILFGPVVFQILGSRVPGLLDLFALAVRNTHLIWPNRRPVTWTPHPGLDDHAVMQLREEYLARLKGVIERRTG